MLKKSVSLIVILLTSLLASVSVYAQSLQASVNKTQVAKNEVFNLRIIADSKLASDAIDFSVLERDFFIGQPRYGSSSTNINGRKSLRTEWTIAIAAMKTGNVTIPSFNANGMKTEPIQLTVSVNPAEPQQADLFSFDLSVDTPELYPQQSTLLRTQLLIKVDPRRLENLQLIPPAVDSMQLEPMGEMKQNQRIMDGLQVTVVEQTYRLIASKPGTHILHGPGLSGSYIYGDPLTGATKVLPIKSKPELMPIKVKPLPENYQGNWLPASALEITQTWQDGNGNSLSAGTEHLVEQGGSLTRTIRISARGIQAGQLPPIDLDYPRSVRVYPEQPQYQSERDGTVTMTVKEVLIPTEPGELNLPGYELNWWNSQQDQAQRAEVPGLTIAVQKSDAGLINLAPLDTIQEAPLSPPAQANTGVDTRWRMLTFVFATLWLTTAALAIWLWKSNKTRSVKPENTSPPVADKSLDSIIRAGDPAIIERAVNEHLRLFHHQFDYNAVEAVKTELRMMNQARFSQQTSSWQPDTLLEHIRHLRKSAPDKKDIPLAKL
ncbi:BatD family protein [Vibrio sp. CAU 1672]|uniref:BatD family protein n=1 Tax=Vibrio sp. CAU 1672 TaxID=3032594 RepID=UPI0023DB3B37|nr:BatD family protein [Vibrio sp. CAU 1672]MDF2152686.1 BatD family protein [Vibrio sp. CAU 1672]